MGKRIFSPTFRALMAGFLLLLTAQMSIGGLAYILMGIFGEAEPLTELQSIGLGFLIWALVPCLLWAAYLLAVELMEPRSGRTNR